LSNLLASIEIIQLLIASNAALFRFATTKLLFMFV